MAGQKQFTNVEEQKEFIRKNLMGPVDGIYLPPEQPGAPKWKDKIEQIRQMTLRDDDVLLLTYPKSGTHWLWEVISMLRHNTAQPGKQSKVQLMMEFVSLDVLAQQPSPRTLNTHLPVCLLPVEEVKRRRLRVVHVYRNVKDVSVSLFHMLGSVKAVTPFPDNLPEFLDWVLYGNKQLYGSYFSYLRQVHEFQQQNQEVPVFNLAYEDVKRDAVKCVKELAHFLELSTTDELCQEIAEACSFENMKKQEEQKSRPVLTTATLSPEDQQKSDAALKAAIYRKGQVGDWKNYYTVAENERAQELIKQEMAKGLPFDLTFE